MYLYYLQLFYYHNTLLLYCIMDINWTTYWIISIVNYTLLTNTWQTLTHLIYKEIYIPGLRITRPMPRIHRLNTYDEIISDT